MDTTVYIILFAFVGIVAGFLAGRMALKKSYASKESDIEEKSKLLVKEAEIEAENIAIEAV